MFNTIPDPGPLLNQSLFNILMKILYWNVRGHAIRILKHCLGSFVLFVSLLFLFISETWIAIDQINNYYWSSLKLKSFAINDRDPYLPNLCGFCANYLDPIIVSSTK